MREESGELSENQGKSRLNPRRIYQTLLWIIPLGVGGNILFSLVKTDVSIWSGLGIFSWEYLVLAVILGLTPWLTGTLRTLLWTRFLGKRLDFGHTLRIVVGSELGSALTPTVVGGGYVKVGLLMQHGFSTGTAASIMTLNSVEDGIFYLFSMPAALLLTSAMERPFQEISFRLISLKTTLSIPFFVAAGMIVVGVLGFRVPGVRRFFRRKCFPGFAERIRKFRMDFFTVYRMIRHRGKWRFALSMTLTAIHWTSRYMVICALLACFNLPVKPVLFFLLQWTVYTLAVFMPTPGGAIGSEAAFFLVYHTYIPQEIIGLTTAAWRFLTYYLQLTLGVFLFPLLAHKTVIRKS